MNQEVKELVHSIEYLREDLKCKEAELKNIQKKCNHVWGKWSDKIGYDYRCTSDAIDPVFRQKTPEIIAVQYKVCENCGKEKIKE